MKRLQIMIDEDLDDALAKLAAEQGESKAALIRRFVRGTAAPPAAAVGRPAVPPERGGQLEPAPVDDVVYR